MAEFAKDDVRAAKKALRGQILAHRDGLPAAKRIEKSLAICEHASSNVDFAPGTVISGFFPIRSEVDLRPLMDRLRQRGARLCLPAVVDKTTIEFRQLLRDGDLIETGFGTIGPSPNAQCLNPAIMLVPLSVFDPVGGRIGYGAGYYDRAIERLCQLGIVPALIGAAFSCQEVEKVPLEAHDRLLDAIVTEDGYRAFNQHQSTGTMS